MHVQDPVFEQRKGQLTNGKESKHTNLIEAAMLEVSIKRKTESCQTNDGAGKDPIWRKQRFAYR